MMSVKELALKVREASSRLALLTTEEKNDALMKIADALEENSASILALNREDVERERAGGMSEALLDRLSLNEKRIASMAEGVRQVAALPDPVGELIDETARPNGLRIRRVRVPLGVIGMIFEARPNVSVDSASLAIKAGSGILLRGSRSAAVSNRALVDVMKNALKTTAVPPDSIELSESASHEDVEEMMRLRGVIDLIIPRGGAGLIRNVCENSRVPVLETGVGNCHVYIHADADPDMAERIAVNAKVSRPSVCNAAETLLFHRDRTDILPRICRALADRGVTVHGCPVTRSLFPEAVEATEEDFFREYLSLDIAVRVVDSLEDAIAHVKKYSTGHTEAIVAKDSAAAEKFMREIDSACVNHNASTRFTDGFEFGFGAEIGISTQKLHARGPVGLRELTSYKYLVTGDGQVRE